VKPERPVLRYFGGKWILAPWIISHFPPHRIYVEPFGGGASVLMRKPRCYSEVYNDLNSEVVNVFRVLRHSRLSNMLEYRLRLTPFAREEFNESYEDSPYDAVEKARRTIIRSFMGFGSNSANREARTGFRANSNRSGTTPAHDWKNYPDEVAAFCDRLAGVVIENRDYRVIIEQHDSPETLFFLDPPYVPSTRSEKHAYQCEMSHIQHEALLEFLPTVSGMVILCGYEHKLYDRLGWQSVKRETHADGARDRIEVLWMNPAAVSAQSQISMFDESQMRDAR
jgi:DNA adenine methylase